MAEDIVFRMLDKKDYGKAADFAVKGMHFGIYFESEFWTRQYGKYFLYSAMTKATQIIAAYDGTNLLGILISRVRGEERCYHSRGKELFVRTVDLVQKLFFKNSSGEYGAACAEMTAEYRKHNDSDGEIICLAVNPDILDRGIGTKLLCAYEKREAGKQIFLFTDDHCSYPFYDHRGFTRAAERDIVMKMKHEIPLKCMLYSKKIGQ